MTKEQVAQIQTEAVRKAFERSRFNRMSKIQREAYEKQDMQYSQFSDFTEEKIQEGREEGREEGRINERRIIALEMLSENEPDSMILKYSKLTPDELAELKSSILKKQN